MTHTIGKVLATEKYPSTISDFHFWTRPDLVLNPFDVIKVDHINNSTTYGVIEEISHITDSSGFLSDYISSDFGDVETKPATYRISMNYVKAKIIGNTSGFYIPVLSGQPVQLATAEEISDALGLSSIKNPVPCGYLQMYQGNTDAERVELTVNVDSKYLIGPEGAHLNISGISGLAAKTSYAMFLIKGIQDKCLQAAEIDPSEDEDAAFVIFNVKGKDLLAIDEMNEFESQEEKDSTLAIYEKLGLSTEPFQNVHYYYPYSDKHKSNTYYSLKEMDKKINAGKAHMFKFEYDQDKENLDLFFANVDDSTGTMESIINHINSDQSSFSKLDGWDEFIKELNKNSRPGCKLNNEITVQSWKKFTRIIKKELANNSVFGRATDTKRELRLSEALSNIKKNQVHVIDIARLSDDMQSFTFGSVMRTLEQIKFEQRDDYTPPSKIIVFIDELNKYASTESPKNSPILKQILDMAARGRSLGIVLFGAEQFRSAIHAQVTGNCSTFAYGRTNAIEIAKSDYKFIPAVYKEMMTRLKQGEYIIQNPIFRSLLNIKFPKPIYKQFKSK